MPRRTFGESMPTHLRAAVLPGVISTVDHLQEVLRYCAPDVADHGWARMCMYQASDAMDSLARVAGVIAAHLEHSGADGELVQRLLRSEHECLRTSAPLRSLGRQFVESDLRVMPERLHERVRDGVALVTLKLQVVVERCGREVDRLWAGGCLAALTDSMDVLGLLVTTIASVHIDVLDRGTLARYQHLFQQRSRSEMPTEDDRAYLAGLLGKAYGDGSSTWNSIGRQRSAHGEGLPVGSYEAKVVAALTMLNSLFEGKYWRRRDGSLLPPVRDAATACLYALRAESSAEAESPLDWLQAAQRQHALSVAQSLDDLVRRPAPAAGGSSRNSNGARRSSQ